MACLNLFPFPLPLEGFYPVGVTEVLACVPPEACPGAPLSAVTEAFAALAEHDRELFIVEFLCLSAVLNTTEVGPCRMHAFRGPPVLCSSDVLTCERVHGQSVSWHSLLPSLTLALTLADFLRVYL